MAEKKETSEGVKILGVLLAVAVIAFMARLGWELAGRALLWVSS